VKGSPAVPFLRASHDDPRGVRVSAIALPLAYAGFVAMLAGALDPLEGSLLIVAGIAAAALAAFIARSPHRRRVCHALGLVVLGVTALWALSAMGGFGGTTGRSIWLGLLVVPYPVGWIVGLVAVLRMIRHEHAAGPGRRARPGQGPGSDPG
jgi:hypothetical protein